MCDKRAFRSSDKLYKEPIPEPKDPQELFEEALQKKRREARLYGYNDLLDDTVR
jgi:hypothetical protein